MVFPDILTTGSEAVILYRRGCMEKRARGGILLLDEDLELRPETLYIGSWRDIPAEVPESICLFCSEGR